tara:strand:- start:192 stop:833 length:642 start_codon:yes stop_codon:yes gene_type:complete
MSSPRKSRRPHPSSTPPKEGRKRLQKRVKDRAIKQKQEALRLQAQMDQEGYEKLREKYAILETAYVSLETAYVGLETAYVGLQKDHAKLEDQFKDLGGTCNILLRRRKTCKKDLEEKDQQIKRTKGKVAELIGKNNALLQNVTKLTATNDALITLVKKLDPRRRSLQESASKKNNPDEKSLWKVRGQVRQHRREANPRNLDNDFAQAGKGSKK